MNLHEKMFQYALLTLMFGLSLCVVNPSYAADGKTWGGAMCSPATGIQVADFNLSGQGGIQNNNVLHRWVVCALTRDSEVPTTVNGGHSTLLVVGERATGESITCQLTKGSISQGFQTISKSEPAGNPGLWDLTFDHNNLVSSQFAAISVTCRLPFKAQLTEINFFEDVATQFP